MATYRLELGSLKVKPQKTEFYTDEEIVLLLSAITERKDLYIPGVGWKTTFKVYHAVTKEKIGENTDVELVSAKNTITELPIKCGFASAGTLTGKITVECGG